MSYLVLARKYRPKTFSEVVGQEHVTRTLANAFDKDRVHHAFLFCGPRGVGKTTLARILGKALNCERGPTAEPCGECSPCVTITDGSAVDYYEMDGASNRGIDSIRELTDAVRYQPAVLRKKVYVIDEVHMLTTEAFNALLKTLEEPPPHVSFVLATTEPHKIPNTILSRCQRYDFKLVPTSRLSAHLARIFEAESLDIDSRAISLLVRESGGSVRDALSLSDQVISYVGGTAITEQAVAEVLGVADRSLTRTLVGALANGDARAALETVDAATGRGVDEMQLARAIVRYLRDLAVVQVAPDSETLVEGSNEERAELAAQARELDRRLVMQMFDRMMLACNDLGDTRQPRLVLELALIEVAATEPVVPLGDLIERLGSLERYLSRHGDPRGGSGGPRNPPPGRAGTPGRSSGPPGGAQSARVAEASPAPPPAEPANLAPADKPEPPFTIEPPARPEPASPMARATEPCPPSGSPPGPPEDPLAEWENILEALARENRRVLQGGYQHAKVLSWDERGVVLGFTPEFEMWAEPERVEDMSRFLRQYYQRPVTLRVERLGAAESAHPSARSVEDIQVERAEEIKRQKREEVLAHPSYKLFEERLGPFAKVEIDTNV